MWETILGIVSGCVQAWNDWRAKQRDDGLVNTGRQLQNTDNLQASVKGDINAQKTAEDVHDLSDDALNAELRDGPATPANRK